MCPYIDAFKILIRGVYIFSGNTFRVYISGTLIDGIVVYTFSICMVAL